MTDFTPITTDELAGSASPKKSFVVFSGNTIIDMEAQASGYIGSAIVALPIDASISLLKPEAMALDWNLGGGDLYNYPMPFTQVNASGAIARAGWSRILVDAKPLSYSLELYIFDLTIQQSDITVEYRILTTSL